MRRKKMPTVTVNVDGTPFQSIASVAECDLDMTVDVTRGPAWRNIMAIPNGEDVVTQKSRFLVAASRRLSLLNWKGEKLDPDQELAWPRTGIDGVSNTEIPAPIRRACCLLAGSINADQSAVSHTASGSVTSNVKKVVAGPAEVEFFHAGSSTADASQVLVSDVDVQRLIKPFLRGASASRGIQICTDPGEGAYIDPLNDRRY